MTYKEFEQKKNTLLNQIEQLKQQYINEHRQYNIGDFVKVTSKKGELRGEGSVVKIELDYSGRINPTINKFKKDGTVGIGRVFVYYDDIIEIIKK